MLISQIGPLEPIQNQDHRIIPGCPGNPYRFIHTKCPLSQYLVNCRTRMRKRNPLLLNAQPARSEEKAVGALLFGGEVGKGGGAVAGVGDGQVLEFGDGGCVHEQ